MRKVRACINILHLSKKNEQIVDTANIHGNTLVHYVLNGGNLEILKYMVDSGKHIKRRANIYNVLPELFGKQDTSDLLGSVYFYGFQN